VGAEGRLSHIDASLRHKCGVWCGVGVGDRGDFASDSQRKNLVLRPPKGGEVGFRLVTRGRLRDRRRREKKTKSERNGGEHRDCTKNKQGECFTEQPKRQRKGED